MARQVRALSAKPHNMNSIPGTKYWEAGDQILKAVLWPALTVVDTHILTH